MLLAIGFCAAFVNFFFEFSREVLLRSQIFLRMRRSPAFVAVDVPQQGQRRPQESKGIEIAAENTHELSTRNTLFHNKRLHCKLHQAAQKSSSRNIFKSRLQGAIDTTEVVPFVGRRIVKFHSNMRRFLCSGRNVSPFDYSEYQSHTTRFDEVTMHREPHGKQNLFERIKTRTI